MPRRCSSSTSRRPASTRRRASSSGIACASCATRTSRSSSRRTTWTRPRCLPTGSGSWITASLLALDTPEALMRSLEGEGTLELAADRPADGAVVDALAALDGVDRVETVHAAAENGAPGAPPPPADSQPLRVRLYLTGDAALLVAPAAAVLTEHGLALQDVKLGAVTLEDVFIHLTGTDAAMSAITAPVIEPGTQWRAFRMVLYRDLYVTWRRVPRLPRAGHPAAAVPALRVRQGARHPQLHAARLHEPALSRLARAHRGDHGDAGARFPARGRVRLDEGDRGPPARADADVLRRRREGALRAAAFVRRDTDHDPDRDPDPRLDPVALGRLPALPRRVGAGSAASVPASAC